MWAEEWKRWQCPEGSSACEEAVEALHQRLALRQEAYAREREELQQEVKRERAHRERAESEFHFAGSSALLELNRLMLLLEEQKIRMSEKEFLCSLFRKSESLLSKACERELRKRAAADKRCEEHFGSIAELRARADNAEQTLKSERSANERASALAESEVSKRQEAIERERSQREHAQCEQARLRGELEQLQKKLDAVSEELKNEKQARDRLQLQERQQQQQERTNSAPKQQNGNGNAVAYGVKGRLHDTKVNKGDIDDEDNDDRRNGEDEWQPDQAAELEEEEPPSRERRAKERIRVQDNKRKQQQRGNRALAERDANANKRKHIPLDNDNEQKEHEQEKERQHNNDSNKQHRNNSKRRKLMSGTSKNSNQPSAQADTVPTAFLKDIKVPKLRTNP